MKKGKDVPTKTDYSHAIRENDFHALRERLRKYRDDNGLKNQEMADKIGCSIDTFKKWINEQNYTAPSLEWLLKISDGLNVSLDYLMGKSDYTAIDGDAIADITGLSDTAIKRLQKWNYHDKSSAPHIANLNAVNMLLSSESASDITDAILQFILSDYMFVGITKKDEDTDKTISERDIGVGEYIHFRYTVATDNYEISDKTPLIDISDRTFVRTSAIERIRESLTTIKNELMANSENVTEEEYEEMIRKQTSKDYHKYVRDYEGNLIEVDTP